MSYLADTDWVIDYLRGNESAIDRLHALAASGLAISLITYGELYDGIYSSSDATNEELGLRRFLEWANILSLNEDIMRRFAHIRGDLRRLGQRIGDMDVLIAATAIEHELTLVTRNLAHFTRIPHLRIYTDS